MATYIASVCGHPTSKRSNKFCNPCYRGRGAEKPVEERVKEIVGQDSFEVRGDSGQVTKTTNEHVRTLEDLIRVCEIDTETWEVERWVANKWEVGAKNKQKNLVVKPLFQVKAWLRRKVAVIAARDEIQALIADAKKQIPPRRLKLVSPVRRGLLLELMIPDLHMGKLAWTEETGWDNYDSKIAEEIFETALEALLARSAGHRIERILFPIGNDLMHSDTKQGTTTAGTQLDMDSRYHKVFRQTRLMMTRAIERLLSIAPVDALIVPGNHDTLAAFHIGDALACYFHNTPSVQVDNLASLRKYYQFGDVMLMLTHGNRGKLEKYPTLMAAERPDMWGATRHREAHTGDKHTQKTLEINGVKVRIFSALCPPDAWHSEFQFVGNQQAAEALVWDRVDGQVAAAFYTSPRRDGKEKAA